MQLTRSYIIDHEAGYVNWGYDYMDRWNAQGHIDRILSTNLTWWTEGTGNILGLNVHVLIQVLEVGESNNVYL